MKIAEGVRVTSFFPGRVRLKVDDLRGNQVLAQAVEVRLASIDGIRHVEANPASGSLLVKYDRRQIAQTASARALGAALRELFPRIDFSRFEHWLAAG
ncbi:MAG: hypothetical protein PVI91_15335 [Gammaproteobacteria bacterium]|jgi:hypothetical protein